MAGFRLRPLLVFLLAAACAAVPAVAVLQPAQAAPGPGGPGTPSLAARVGGLASTAFAGELSAVSAPAAGNAWAAGSNCATSPCTTLTVHWNGSAWSKVTSPNPGSGSRTLDGVAAVSGTSAWAVGDYCTTSACSVTDTLILHWNGSTWSKITSPNPSATINELTGVYATSGSNAWAVGQYFSGAAGPYDTLILHWNGSSWSKVKSPNPSVGGNFLSAVSATSASAAWAVGSYYNSANIQQTLALRWNGTAWSKVTSPSPSATFNNLTGVSAASASIAWAAGDANGGNGSLILHWNGTAWSAVKDGAPANAGLAAAAATSGSNAWAVGQYCPSNCGNPAAVIDTLIVHWNGTGWSKVKSPSPSSTGRNLLFGVSATAAGNAWAVGTYPSSSNVPTALILHWNGTNWSKV